MREIQSFDDFERALKASKTPYINPETIKTGVYQYAKSHKIKRLSRKLIPILIAILVLSIGTAAFGDTLNSILFNKKGEKVFEYRYKEVKPNEDVLAIHDEWHKYQPLKDKLQKEAKPGELSVLIISSIYGKERSVYPFQYREPIYNINDLKNSTSTKFRVPVSDDITFNEGIITFKSVSQANVGSYFKISDDKYKEAKDKGLEYIVWTEPLTNEAESIELKYTVNRYFKEGYYTNKSTSFSLRISKAGMMEKNTTSSENVSKIRIGDEEVLYIASATPEIIYVDSTAENPLTYHFFFEKRHLKDTIVSLIQNMQ